MPEIIYSSLVRFPIKITSIEYALNYLGQFVKTPDRLKNIKTEIILVDEYHINIIRYFTNLNEYLGWIHSTERNDADSILMHNRFYLYTKQAHNDIIR